MADGFSQKLAERLIHDYEVDGRNKVTKIGALSVKTDTSIQELADFIGVSRQAVYAWLTGKYSPSKRSLKKADELIELLLLKLKDDRSDLKSNIESGTKKLDVRLEEDVAKYFIDSNSVNEALRFVIRLRRDLKKLY